MTLLSESCVSLTCPRRIHATLLSPLILHWRFILGPIFVDVVAIACFLTKVTLKIKSHGSTPFQIMYCNAN